MKFVICIQNRDYPTSLEVRKLYQVLDDKQAQQHSMLRIIDESGEDYLYPASYFVDIDLPETVHQLFAIAH